MAALLAGLPIVAVLGLMIGRGWAASRAGSVGAALALVIAIAAFDLGRGTPAGVGMTTALGGTFGEALFTSATILWIVLPALAIHHLQVATGATERLRLALAGLASDPRILALLIGWFFALFVEGAAGFGASVALAAPFLVGVGYRPLDAVVVAMIGHAIGVSFGAVGTPVVAQVAATGLDGAEIARATADLHLAVGWVLMVVLVLVASRAVGLAPRGAIWGWAAFAAAAFLGPFWLIAATVGPELPTLAGALLGAAVFVVGLRVVGRRSTADGVPTTGTAPSAAPDVGPTPVELAPPVERRRRPSGGAGDVTEDRERSPVVPVTAPGSAGDLLRAGAPYLVLIALVTVTRLVPAIGDPLGTLEVAWTLPGGFAGSFQPLLHPGTLLAVGFLGGALIQRVSPAEVGRAVGRTLTQLGGVTIALVAMLTLARLMVHAGMTRSLAEAAAGTAGGAWPVLAPLVGVLGTFVTGSATASNVLFTDLQVGTAEALDLPVAPLVGAQGFGAAVGNIVCPHNIVAAGATVGLTGAEGQVLRRTLAPAVGYALLGGLLLLVLTAS